MKILGIDPAYGKKNAFCIFEKDRVLKFGSFSLDEFSEILLKSDCNLVAIENAYFNLSIDNPATYAKLNQVIGFMKFTAEQMGYKVALVNPISWMTAAGMNPKRSKERDNWVISVAKGLVCRNGFYKMNIDEASAIHIAGYAARRG